MNHVSAHARVFEGVRMARMRAFDEAQLPDGQYHEQCIYADRMRPPNCDHIAEFLWVHAPSGKVSPLCKTHTDHWLDDGDEVEDDDPPALIPLRKPWRS